MRWIGLLVLLLTQIPFVTAQTPDCVGLIAPLLNVGITGRVKPDDGIGLALHSEANSSSTVIRTLPEGTGFLVISDATCRDGWVWWQVRLADGQEGYLAEGNATTYFAEAFALGVHLLIPDTANPNQINRVMIDPSGTPQPRPPLILSPQGGSAASLWQSFELTAASTALADRLANCADRVPAGLVDVESVPFDGSTRTYYPSPDGEQVLIFRDYLFDLPRCDGTGAQFGTTYVYVAAPQQGERLIFPYSQQSDPPPGQHCQPPTVAAADYATHIEEVAWSQDGHYAALSVRYLRNSQFYPCAFYHIFVIDTATLGVQYIGEGQRLGWYNGRLYYAHIERSDPNTPGVQRMFHVRPNGEDRLEIPLPAGINVIGASLPYNAAGDRLLVCTDAACGQVAIWSLRNYSLGTAFAPPINGTASFMAGDTQFLWLSAAGQVYQQGLADGSSEMLATDTPVTAVHPGWMGAVLHLDDGQMIYLDQGGTLHAVEGG